MINFHMINFIIDFMQVPGTATTPEYRTAPSVYTEFFKESNSLIILHLVTLAIPFLQKPFSIIRAPFAPNPLLLYPDFPPENLFSQAHLLWPLYDIVSNPTGSSEPGGREGRHQPTFEGAPKTPEIKKENQGGNTS